MGSLGATVGAIAIRSALVAAEARDVAVIGIHALTFHRACPLALDIAGRETATSDRAPGPHTYPTSRNVVTEILAIRAADATTSRGAIAFELAVILARVAALLGVVAFRFAAIAANGAAVCPGVRAIQQATIPVAAQYAIL
jgi:hypothetical protein